MNLWAPAFLGPHHPARSVGDLPTPLSYLYYMSAGQPSENMRSPRRQRSVYSLPVFGLKQERA